MNPFSRLTLLFITTITASCAAVYVPNAVNVPLLGTTGDAHINAAAGMNGYDLQGACAVTDHIGVMLNTSFANRQSDSSDDFHRHSFFEAGAGYYLPMGEIARFEAFGGAGWGTVAGLSASNSLDTNNWFYYNDRVEGSFYRVFIQPSIGFTTDFFDMAVTTRTVYFNAYELADDDSDWKTMSSFVFEPTLTMRAGYKHVMAHVQTGASIPFAGDDYFKWRPLILNVGIAVRFNVKPKP